MNTEVHGHVLLQRLNELGDALPAAIHENLSGLCEMLGKLDNTIIVAETHPIQIATEEMRAAIDRMTRCWLEQRAAGVRCLPHRADWSILQATSKTIAVWLEGRRPGIRAEAGLPPRDIS